jgi:membrane-associated phospholipid phosphatase
MQPWFKPTCSIQGAEEELSLEELLLGPRLIEILQNLFAPQFNWIFAAITLLGDDAVLVGLGAVVYWCLDKRSGRLVTYVLLFGAYLNFFLKILVQWPRPPVELRIIEKDETSYGFPSGHAQDSTTFWAWMCLDFRRWILAALGTMIVIAVGISRIYLGVHYPAQVIGGWVIGLVVTGVGMMVLRHLPTRNKESSVMIQALFVVAMLVPLAVAASLGAMGEVNPGRIGGYLFGFWLGTLAEARYVQFTTEVNGAQKILRIAIGGAVTGFLVLTLGRILPETSLIPSFSNSVIQGLTVALIIPALFSVIERSRTRKDSR